MVNWDLIREDEDVDEEESYGNAVGSLKQIALEHVKKISNLICVELTPGFWEKRPVKVAGGVVNQETYKPDLRIGYCNAVEFLCDMVYPEGSEEFADFKEIADNYYKTIDEEELSQINWDERVKISKRLFRSIIKMFHEIGFFEDKSSGSIGVGIK